MGINYWTIQEKYEIASWEASFPKGNMTSPWEVLPFVQKVLEAAEREEVYRVKRVPSHSERLGLKLDLEYRAYPGGPDYGQYLEQILNETDQLLFFRQLSSSPGYLPEYRIIAPARLSYYDLDRELIDEEVEDVGELLRRVRPLEYDLPNDWQEMTEEQLFYARKSINSYKKESSAIFFSGDLISKDRFPDNSTYLFINLYTDIWFPEVGGFLEDQDELYENRVFYDNRELALRHTPRLNRFLISVRDLTLEFGGTWSVDRDPESEERYDRMHDENGINLDI
jgi:hypothetical protein